MEKLLVHACCAPCSTTALDRLYKNYNIGVFFYNPNIYPEKEYIRRKKELIKYIEEVYGSKIKYFDTDYDSDKYYKHINGKEEEREGGARCKVCFDLRLDETAKFAKNKGFDMFATTLTLSPHKNAELINKLGEEKAIKYNIKYLPTNFKKQDGFLFSLKKSKEHNLYRQDYCGCEFSIRNTKNKNIS